jgi:hypothetical protein
MADGELAKRRAQLPLDARACLHGGDPDAARRWLDEWFEELDGGLRLFTEAELGRALSLLAQRVARAAANAAAETGPKLTAPVMKRLIAETMREAGVEVQETPLSDLRGPELDAAAAAYGLKRRIREDDVGLRERIEEEQRR